MTRNQRLILMHGIMNRFAWILEDLKDLNRDKYDKDLADIFIRLEQVYDDLKDKLRKEEGQA